MSIGTDDEGKRKIETLGESDNDPQKEKKKDVQHGTERTDFCKQKSRQFWFLFHLWDRPHTDITNN